MQKLLTYYSKTAIFKVKKAKNPFARKTGRLINIKSTRMTLVILGRVSSRLSKLEISSIKFLRWIKTHYSHCMENAGDDGILLLILSSCPKRGWTKQDNIGMVQELTLFLFQFSSNSSNFFYFNFWIH